MTQVRNVVIGLAVALTAGSRPAQAARPPAGLASDDWTQIRRAIQSNYVHEAQVFGQEEFAGQLNDWFGSSVAASGDTVVVGTPLKEVANQPGAGAAYVFVRAGSMWVQQQVLVSTEASTNDEFGASVAIAGDTIVVGATHADIPGAADAGAAYVFVRSGTAWAQQQKLSAPDGAPLDVFGGSVSISGDTVVVGASGDDTVDGPDAGSAYVFVRWNGTWSPPQKLTASDGAANDSFGVSVSIDSYTIIAGAYGKDTAGGTDAGCAYVFVRSDSAWSEQARLTASDGAVDDLFGAAVSVSGDSAVVGAMWDDNAGGTDAGAAYVFVRAGPAWMQQQKLLGSDVIGQDYFGTSVSISDDMIGVGARGHDTAAGLSAGAAYVYLRAAGTWAEAQKLVAPDAAEDDRFGQSVALAGVTLVAGAPLHDAFSTADAGAAYTFMRSGTTWAQPQTLVARRSDSSPDGFGYAVALSGDTLVVGAFQDGVSDAGAAYVFVRDVTSWTLQQKLFAPDGAAGDAFGLSAALAGDTAVVGAWLADTPSGTDAGAAYVFVRSGTAWVFQQKLTAPDGAIHDHFGTSVALSGDTVVVGAQGHATTNGSDAGASYVFVRSGASWTLQQRLEAADGAPFDEFGISVAVDGDTAAAGAVWHDTPLGVDSGTVYVFARSGTTWTEQQRLLPSDANAGDAFGASVSLQADTLVAGAPRHATAGALNQGAGYVWVRAGTSWSLQQELLAADGNGGDQFGVAVSVSEDTIAVGAPYVSDVGISQAGAAYVFERSGTAWTQASKLEAPVPTLQARFGNTLAVEAGTVTIGAYGDVAPTGATTGSAHVFRMYPLTSDVRATITADPPVVTPGLDVAYTILVDNAGPGPAPGVEVMLPTPPGLVFLATSGACTTSFPCPLGTLGSGDARTIFARYRVPSGYAGPNPVVATVTATTAGADPDLGNNTATAAALVGPGVADLALTMQGPATAGPGDLLNYSLIVTHLGVSDASSVEISSPPPPGLLFVANTGDCTTPFPCLLGIVPAGASRAIVSTFQVPGGYTGPNPIVNQALVTSVTMDPDVANNFASVSTTFIPVVLAVTAIAVDAPGNGVLQPNETVVVAPTWRNAGPAVVANVAGTATSFTGPPPAAYTISDATATYGTIAPGAAASCGADCYALAIAATSRPATHWDADLTEEVTPGVAQWTWHLHVGDSFTDVLGTSAYYRFVETVLHNGVTAGCTAVDYCPASATTREQMAVFVLVAKEGAGYAPQACSTPVFGDVPASSPFCRWIEELARRGVVGGCGGGNYCPGASVSREQIAVFVLRTLDPQLDPPACTTPLFGDVPPSSPFCRWIEELARRGVVTGCGGGNFCPSASVTREQMAVFLAGSFGLLLYSP